MPKLTKPLEPPYKPLLCQEAIDRFEEIINKNSVVLEFGSGASTLWLAERVGVLISIEHDEEWHNEVIKKLAHSDHVVVHLVKPEHYTGVPANYPDASFDFVFVDCFDHYRIPCLKSSLPKLKPGGWLVVDDTNWPMLKSVVSVLGRKWEREDYSGLKYGRQDGVVKVGATTFLRKPEA